MSNYLNSRFLGQVVKTPNKQPVISFLDMKFQPQHDESILKLANKRVTAENREKQIDSVLTDKEYIPTKIEDTPEYQDYLKSDLGGMVTPLVVNKTIQLETITLPKETQSTLKDHLSNLYYNKIVEMCDANEKSLNLEMAPMLKNFEDNFFGRLKKYIWSDYDYFLFDELTLKDNYAIARRIVTKIIHTSNHIAVTSRRAPADFAIVHPNLISKYLNLVIEFDPKRRTGDKRENFDFIGQIGDINIFTNSEQDENLIIIGISGDINKGGVVIFENNTEISKTEIKWTGKITELSESNKYHYEKFTMGFLKDLPLYKRILFKLFRKKLIKK